MGRSAGAPLRPGNKSLPYPLLMLVTQPTDRLEEIVAEAVAGGVNAVQLRDKDTPPDVLRETARRLRNVTRERALFLVNTQAEAALAVGADGVHLGEAGESLAAVRARLAPAMLVGRSIHQREGAEHAVREHADYLIAGTLFASASHPDRTPAGLDFLRAVCAVVSIPVIAIGGITPQNAGACLQAGAWGVAVLSPLMQADDPRTVAQSYRAALDQERRHD